MNAEALALVVVARDPGLRFHPAVGVTIEIPR
jgi:hypothetical protein